MEEILYVLWREGHQKFVQERARDMGVTFSPPSSSAESLDEHEQRSSSSEPEPKEEEENSTGRTSTPFDTISLSSEDVNIMPGRGDNHANRFRVLGALRSMVTERSIVTIPARPKDVPRVRVVAARQRLHTAVLNPILTTELAVVVIGPDVDTIQRHINTVQGVNVRVNNDTNPMGPRALLIGTLTGVLHRVRHLIVGSSCFS